MKRIGWIVGGPDVVLDAVLDVLTPSGTLMMGVGWEDDPYTMEGWTPERRQAYLEDCPAFDPARSRASREWGILTEYLRTRPGACRSAFPGHSFAAVGARAAWMTADHPLRDGLGPGSPLEKLMQADGMVLLLGAPLTAVTLLHYAEYLADIPDKRTIRYQTPILRDGRREWVQIEELDSSNGIVDWRGEDYFILIMREFLAAERGRTGQVGCAPAHLFHGPSLVGFAVQWMERNFRGLPNRPAPRPRPPT